MNTINNKDYRRSILSITIIINLLFFLIPCKHTNAQGPNAPEAAAFEPVDATDMVNLATGDMSYVLPIINIPSPEGGYPLSLAYHAGIAMDQEASWVGLGWNLNPGAINRSVNGYPDDYKLSRLAEFFYDEGGEESVYSASASFSAYSGGSVGLGLSWGSNKSLGGHISVGYGWAIGEAKIGGSITIGTNGVGLGVGYTSASGLTLGANISSNGTFGGKVGFNSNGEGFSVGLSSSGAVSFGIDANSGSGNTTSVDFTLSSSGIGISGGVTNKTSNNVDGGAGVGLQLQFENTLSMGDYTTKSSGWSIPLFVPTPVGFLSFSFGKTTFRYYLGKKEVNHINGPIYFADGTENRQVWRASCYEEDPYDSPVSCGGGTFNSEQEAIAFAEEMYNSSGDYGSGSCICQIELVRSFESFMDAYEVSLADQDLSNTSNIIYNNAAFPSYDKYNVQAQGLSGGMSSRLYENGALFSLSNKETNQGFTVKYNINGSTIDIPDHVKFDSKPYFYFDNEISSFIDVKEANFDITNPNNTGYYTGGVELAAKPRNKNASYIEYYTNSEIIDSYQEVKSKGYLRPIHMGFDRTKVPSNGIGGFKITAVDGKTYHYAIPVYNHETITRTIGVVKYQGAWAGRPKLEKDSYFEKRQLEPYATHWLLTAVTGPDFYDQNNNGIADDDDYGYWVNFEYGKWSEAFVWKSPYGKDYIESSAEKDVKTSIKGRKDIYYLNKVSTRTHAAILIKSERSDAKSIPWEYKSVRHLNNFDQNSNAFVTKFNVPSQNTLRLDRIVLVKKSDDNVINSYGISDDISVNILYSPDKQETAHFNLKDNIIDTSDNVSDIVSKAIKVIDFKYDYSLARGTLNAENPSQGRLTLTSVNFKGKSGKQLIPPYRFEYINPNYSFDIKDKDAFGYKKDDNDIWSLKEIETPQGGKIKIDYDDHSFKPVIGASVTFTRDQNNGYSISRVNDLTYKIRSTKNIGIQIGEELELTYDFYCSGEEGGNCGGYCGPVDISCNFKRVARVMSQEDPLTYIIKIDDFPCQEEFEIMSQDGVVCSYGESENLKAKYKITNAIENFGGIRVSSITTTDGIDSYTSKYNYGINGNGIGCISYIPFAPELDKELPYSQELPAPRIMYEYVSMESLTAENTSLGKTLYKFNVLKEKDPNKVKFGDLYEVIQDTVSVINTSSNKKVTIAKHTIKDNFASIGQLLEVSAYNNKNQLISKIENHYYKPDETPNNVGVTKESFQSYKTIDYTIASKMDKLLINSSSRIRYPNLLKASTEYKANNEYSTEFGELDEVTGLALETLSTSSKGDRLKSQSIPAYHKYPEMGSKVINPTHKNMLTQQAASYNYIQDQVGNWKPIGVGITTWNNNWTYHDVAGNQQIPTANHEKIWRRHANYTWEGDRNANGLLQDFNENTDDGFDWTVGALTQSNPKWKKVSETTLYNHYSMPLEIEDINQNHAATKMGDNDAKVMTTGNAGYSELFFSSAEYDLGSNYLDQGIRGANLRTTDHSHTGKYSLAVSPNQRGFQTVLYANQHKSGKYKVSVWVKKQNMANARIHINGTTKAFNGEQITAGDWVQMNHYENLDTANETLFITSAAEVIHADDFRICPIASSMTSYVYNEWDELEYILGANNLGAKFEYDAAGRLIRTYQEVIDQGAITGGFKKVVEHKYNYKSVAAIDDNGNGIIDPIESYPPLGAHLWVENFETRITLIKTSVFGGSGEVQYRWAQGDNPNTLNYGAWGASDSINIITDCPNGRKHYKCQIKDQVTGAIIERVGSHLRTCSNDGGPGDQVQQ